MKYGNIGALSGTGVWILSGYCSLFRAEVRALCLPDDYWGDGVVMGGNQSKMTKPLFHQVMVCARERPTWDLSRQGSRVLCNPYSCGICFQNVFFFCVDPFPTSVKSLVSFTILYDCMCFKINTLLFQLRMFPVPEDWRRNRKRKHSFSWGFFLLYLGKYKFKDWSVPSFTGAYKNSRTLRSWM